MANSEWCKAGTIKLPDTIGETLLNEDGFVIFESFEEMIAQCKKQGVPEEVLEQLRLDHLRILN